MAYLFSLYAALCVLSLVFVHRCVPETKGVPHSMAMHATCTAATKLETAARKAGTACRLQTDPR